MAKLLKYFTRGLLVLSFVILPVLVFLNVNAIQDWWKLRGYIPPDAIIGLADADAMTNKARHLFYINHPQLINDKSQLHQQCPQSEQTIVLGCYHAVQNGIAIFDVTDVRLDGVEEVTAAHEMLHAAYDRLNKEEKENVDTMLNDYFTHQLKDVRIIDTVKSYQKSEPNDVVNEMHSIFGTEISSLPQPLENYYKQYFNNRQQVINFSTGYQSVFTQNQDKLEHFKTQIETLKLQLNKDKQEIERLQENLAQESKRMQQLLSDDNAEQYNAAVEPYNSKVNNLRTLIASYNFRVAQVNNLVEQYNLTAYNQENLYQSLDTRVPTQPSR